MKIRNRILYIVICVTIAFLALKKCEPEPKIITKTKVEYVKVTDTVTNVIIEKVPEKVYLERIRTEKGKDSIIYVDKPSEVSIEANKYDAKLESNNATADLQITTTGELLDVQGTINYEKEIKIIETKEIVPMSGLFIYGEGSVNSQSNYGLGLDYVHKNKWIIGTSVNYNEFVDDISFNVKIGIKLF